MYMYVPCPYINDSKEYIDKKIEELRAKGLIIQGIKDDDYAHKRRILRDRLQHIRLRVNPSLKVPEADSAFEKICADYKEDWEKHKAKMIVTSKTYTTKGK